MFPKDPNELPNTLLVGAVGLPNVPEPCVFGNVNTELLVCGVLCIEAILLVDWSGSWNEGNSVEVCALFVGPLKENTGLDCVGTWKLLVVVGPPKEKLGKAS